MVFPYLTPPLETRTTNRCNAEMERSNRLLDYLVDEYKGQWSAFWNRDLPAEDMQAKLDKLAQTSTTDLGQSTNALDAYFAKAFRLLAFLLAEDASRFTDAKLEHHGTMLPDFPSYPYQKYFSAGWYYTIEEETGRMIVSTPCLWSE